MKYFRENFTINPRKTLSPYFSQPVVYNLNTPPEPFSREEIRIIYKTYFASGIIPIIGRLKSANIGDDMSKEQYAVLYLALQCNNCSVDSDKLLDKIERYSKWNEFIQMLCNSMSSPSSAK